MKVIRVRIHGRVQGVWYRAWTVEQARRLELDGWVRNRSDDTVEALFAGSATQVDAMLALCHEGPPRAAVERIELEAVAERPEQGFRKLPTL
ncbi:acylphosphatase [Geminicoccaceae bacterium 1502E]|nr:acylphosphatase [Geminicoccaceae bacterium 1502E]